MNASPAHTSKPPAMKSCRVTTKSWDRKSTFGRRSLNASRLGTKCIGRPFKSRADAPEHRDNAAISNPAPSIFSPACARAAIAVGNELTRLAATLAFFRAKSPLPNGDRGQFGRLRV